MTKIYLKLYGFILLVLFISCKKVENLGGYKTKNVFIVIVDGARYSETWGDSLHRYIPYMSSQLAKAGVINAQFFNNGETYTLAGHVSITTGVYQTINNDGTELPINPSIFQYWHKNSNKDKTKAWIISSKDKLEVLANCNDHDWFGKFTPSINCGIDGLGLGSGYRHDSLTFETLIDILSEYQPNIVLINFREPDYSAHLNSWVDYLSGIKNTDKYIYSLWEFLQSNNFYNGTTTLFVTNDHGRHLDTVADGFVSHGDSCLGCKHIFLYAFGPDFRKGIIVNTKRELIDLPNTISELLGFKIDKSEGDIMYELFN